MLYDLSKRRGSKAKIFKYSLFNTAMEKDKICEGKSKYAGFFDFKQVYNFLYSWFSDYEYDVEENSYSEKIKPEGKEIEIAWTAERDITDYFRFVLNVRWLITGMTSQSVGGKKLNKGNIEVKITGYLVKDYEEKWEATAFLKFLRDVYDKYIIKGRIEQYEDKISEEVDEILAQIKSFLALEAKREA